MSKSYADENGTSYNYGADGKLATRYWTRTVDSAHVETDYAYDGMTGELAEINYSDGTPEVLFTYNRVGALSVVQDAVGTRKFTYDSGGLWQTAEAINSIS